MSTLIKYLIGIDVAKDKLDACLVSLDTDLNFKVKATHKFTNTESGFKEILEWIQKHCKEKVPVQTLMEATGVYHEKLAIYLTERQKQVSIVLPNKSHKYLQSLGLKSKNDKIDAKGLAIMCAHGQFNEWKPISKYFYQLRLLTRHYQSTQEIKTGFINQLHALKHSGYPNKSIAKRLEKNIVMFNEQLKLIKKEIVNHVNSDLEIKRKFNQICLIKGLDTLSVATVISETNGFEFIKNVRQLVSYVGYDIVENQSGNHVGRTKISKKGNSRIRRILHMPAFNVVRFKEPAFLNLYLRVFNRTGLKMKAYVAVQRKLLELIYTLWKKDQAYEAGFANTSGNDEPRAFFPLHKGLKKVVPSKDSTTLDRHQYNELPEALFPLIQT